MFSILKKIIITKRVGTISGFTRYLSINAKGESSVFKADDYVSG